MMLQLPVVLKELDTVTRNAYNFLQALKVLKVNYSFVRSFRDFYRLLIEYFSEISSIMMIDIDKADCGLIQDKE